MTPAERSALEDMIDYATEWMNYCTEAWGDYHREEREGIRADIARAQTVLDADKPDLDGHQTIFGLIGQFCGAVECEDWAKVKHTMDLIDKVAL